MTLALIAHRGASAFAPENTLAAFRKAKELGASWVEFDVMLTQDNEAIVFHDEDLARTTNGLGRVDESQFPYIKSLSAGSWFNNAFKAEPVPTFKEVIQLLIELDLNANIEIKPCGNTAEQTATAVMDILNKYWPSAKNLPLLSSFEHSCLRVCLDLNPYFPRGLLLDSWQDDAIALARQFECVSVHLNQQAVTPEIINDINEQGFAAYAYTVNTLTRAKELELMGVTGIFTDNLLTEMVTA